jgi:hypothetical protein
MAATLLSAMNPVSSIAALSRRFIRLRALKWIRQYIRKFIKYGSVAILLKLSIRLILLNNRDHRDRIRILAIAEIL